MDKKMIYVISLAGLVTFIICSYLLNGKKNKVDVKKLTEAFGGTIEQGGKPDQMAETTDTLMENADMVSEGSQFGVHYYNEIAEEIEKIK